MNGMITMVMQRAAVAKDTRSAVVKLAKEFDVLASDVIGYGMVSHTTTFSRWRGRCA